MYTCNFDNAKYLIKDLLIYNPTGIMYQFPYCTTIWS